MGGSNQVDISGALILEAEKDFAQPFRRNFLSKSLLADFIILAVTASEGTPGKEDGSASTVFAQARLFPEMKRCSGGFQRCALSTQPRLSPAVCAAHARTQSTVFIHQR